MKLITDTVDEIKNMKPRKVFLLNLLLIKKIPKDYSANNKFVVNSLLGLNDLEESNDFILL